MSRPLWAGRFEKSPSQDLKTLADSLHFDRVLWREDIEATRAHASALVRAGILTAEEQALIFTALDEAAASFEENKFEFSDEDEDIHSSLERFLTTRLGETGAKIHAGRSRNDLVVTDLRLWLKKQTRRIARRIYELQEALYRQSRENISVVMPGYTHTQRAQPVYLPHILLAHAFALSRDFERFIAVYRRCDVSPLGAAAFAGTTLAIDPRQTASDLGFSKVFDNAADAVASRDFALEFLAAAAILMSNASRMAEEVVLWTSSEFGFAELDDSFATGSSIMPQKKNADPAELIRAKSSRSTANLVHLLGVVKGLPMTYNRDLQEDKEPVFDSAATVQASLNVLRGMFQTITFHPDAMRDAVTRESLASDLAEHLAAVGVPFREAHEAVGKLVAAHPSLEGLDPAELAIFHKSLTPEMLNRLDAISSVESRSSHGGTSSERIAEQLARFESVMDDEERWLAGLGEF